MGTTMTMRIDTKGGEILHEIVCSESSGGDGVYMNIDGEKFRIRNGALVEGDEILFQAHQQQFATSYTTLLQGK